MLIILIELHKTFTKLKICYESRNDHVVYNKKVFFLLFLNQNLYQIQNLKLNLEISQFQKTNNSYLCNFYILAKSLKLFSIIIRLK